MAFNRNFFVIVRFVHAQFVEMILHQESFSSCAAISHYDLTIKLNEKQIFYKRYSVEETREKVLEDLDPYTNYTIILIAVNNAFYQSSAEPRYITTPELGMCVLSLYKINF